MRVASSPHYRPGQLIERHVLWYALFALLLVALGVIAVIAATPSPPAETHLVGPFRWMIVMSMA